jgi:Leucine-rich repeat (LRR) protein
LIDAAVRLNPKLRLSPRCQQSALHAITWLDLSNNDLSEVPAAIFQMQSLKILVLSQNKLVSLLYNFLTSSMSQSFYNWKAFSP